MVSKRSFRRGVLFLAYLAFGFSASPLLALTATLSVNAASTVNSFVPAQAFGINVDHGQYLATYQAVQPTMAAAGIRFLRYPGGSGSDVYHWNGSGSWTGGVWVPLSGTATQGFNDAMVNNGTSGAGISLLDDGLTSTAWVSNADTDFPNGQWVYVDLGSTQTVTQVQIWWATPYATAFKVQYWNPSYGTNQWSPYLAASNQWLDSGLGSITGTGGEQTVNLASLSTRYIRIYMTASSAGAGGAYSISELEAFDGGTQLTTNTNGSTQSTTVVSSMAPNSSAGLKGSMSFDEFMQLCNSYSPSGTPLITVNFGTGSAQEAAAWVYYANVVKGYHVKYWEIGNELLGNWEAGGPLSATDYGRRFVEYYNAMTAVDPSVVLLGPLSGPTDSANNLNTDTYIQDFATRVVSSGEPQALGGIDIHDYATDNDNTDTDILATPASWNGWATAISSALSAAGVPNPSSLPVVMSEYNSSGDNINVRLVNALWTVNWLGQYLSNFGTRAWANFFACINSSADESSAAAAAGSWSVFEGTSGPYLNQPFSGFWALQLLSQDWAIPGDTRDHTLVSCSSTGTNLIGYADLRPDGILSLIVSNQDPTNTYTATVNIAGYSPQASAQTYTWSSAQYAWETSTVPYHVTPDSGPASSITSGVSPSFSCSFAPYSLTVFQFKPQGTPTPSPSPSPAWTVTATPSPTLSPTPWPTACSTIVCYNGETVTGGVDLADGNSYTTSATVVEDAAAGYNTPKGLDITYSFNNFWGDFTNNFANYNAAAAFNLSSYNGMEFWVRTVSGTLNNLYVQLGDSSNTGSPIGAVGVDTYLPGGVTTTWQKVYIPLSAFTGINLSSVEFYSFYINGLESGYIEVYVDDIDFLRRCSTATETPSPSNSPSDTASRTPSPSPSQTPSLTSTPSETSSATATSSDSPSPTSSPSQTPSATPSSSFSASPSPVESPTATFSQSQSPTSTQTLNLAWSPTDSPTISETATASPTPSASATASGTATATLTASGTATPSASGTPTLSATATASSTASGTATGTATLSGTQTLTPMGTATLSDTATPSSTSSGTVTATLTASVLSTASSSPTLTAGASATATPTNGTGAAPSATLTVTALSTGTPVGQGGQFQILKMLPVPNPNPMNLAVLLSNPADGIDVRIYTVALVRVRSFDASGSYVPGWNKVPLPAAWSASLPGGLYYVEAWPALGGKRGATAAVAKLVLLK